MKTIIKSKIVLTIMLVSLFVIGVNAQDQTYKIDKDKTELKWKGEKVAGNHFGTIALESGSLTADASGIISSGEFKIDMNSIVDLDLESGTWNKMLIKHLKSDDFFSIKKHPYSTLKITSVEALENGLYKATGELTIKDITQTIEFTFTSKSKGGNLVAFAEIKVDRTKYDIKYRSGTYFDDLGDKMIYDEFTVNVKIVAQAEGVELTSGE